ncbi:hypothetical protein COCNU_08G011390 [Cocos nucifera]|uniref:Uncharacterized protein n=1 Tax=Cocos nucifera TaxID=13894 RepID=A0A8K0IIQ8_COCNU|nr:hypothetical protein COCNU_08G011390 [Cocos nucifera]
MRPRTRHLVLGSRFDAQRCQEVADAVKVTMGPKGGNVVLEQSFGAPEGWCDCHKERRVQGQSRTWEPA